MFGNVHAAVQNQGKGGRGKLKTLPGYKKACTDLGRMAGKPKYQKRICTGKGVFRKKCTKTWEIFSKTLLPDMRINTKTRAKAVLPKMALHPVSCSVTLILSKSHRVGFSKYGTGNRGPQHHTPSVF